MISVECYCKVNTAGLHVWKWLTVENIRNVEKESNIISYTTLLK